MDTVKLPDKGKCLIVAHRGLSGIEKENTNSAFVAAGNRSYFGIETDVYKTKDGHFVLMHDSNAERVSGVSLNIKEAPYEDIKNVILNDVDGKVGRNDLRIPDLTDYIDICKKYDKVPVLELKMDFTKEELEEIVAFFKERDYFEKLVVISFKYDCLLRYRELYPDMPIQYLTGYEYKFSEETIEKLQTLKADWDANYLTLSKEIVDYLHSLGIKVNAWTVNKPEDAQALLDLGVDFITTNILE